MTFSILVPTHSGLFNAAHLQDNDKVVGHEIMLYKTTISSRAAH